MDKTRIYPEHEKLKKINHLTEAIHEFLEWCQDEKNAHLARYAYASDMEGYGDIGGDIGMITVETYDRDEWMAEFFDIDLKVIEQEKQSMIKEMQEMADANLR